MLKRRKTEEELRLDIGKIISYFTIIDSYYEYDKGNGRFTNFYNAKCVCGNIKNRIRRDIIEKEQ